ncbi:TetR/AcrR family transcriptional regulator [Mycobacterium sp. 1164966.3]|uniref:TetR/AcrR family transcriptional regulator n=1 Tax=Mycobacterium sp. 1164966.3 TaxID=1856861 RepID=UPI0015610B41|nr:TetR/AcrR family transcriptional regulator [Mycobacterium sp. 1164966.3]
MIAAAAELFAENGYARTTLARIADAAGVSPETVQGQGPKAALLISAAEYAALGVAGEENLLNLEVGRRLIAIQDRDEALDYLVAFVAELQERTAKLGLALIGGASVDPELDRYLNDFIASINKQVRRVLGVWRDQGWLREDVSFDELVETSAVICSVDTFLRITHRDGWAVSRYKAWARRMLAEAVLRS